MFRYMKRALAGVWSFRGVCVLCALAAVVVNGTHHSYIMERCTDTSRPAEFRKILRGSEKLKVSMRLAFAATHLRIAVGQHSYCFFNYG